MCESIEWVQFVSMLMAFVFLSCLALYYSCKADRLEADNRALQDELDSIYTEGLEN